MQWVVVPSHMTVQLPESVGWKEAGCIQPLAIAVQLGRRANMRPHQTVAVLYVFLSLPPSRQNEGN
jgi:D-xylulose reductase